MECLMDHERLGGLAVLRTRNSRSPPSHERMPAESFAIGIQGHLQELLASPQFDGASRSRDFLTFIVEETLAGRGDGLNQAVIATRVFGRKGDFDAILDPVVRVQAGRLRRSLERYYLLTGDNSPVRIELPKGSYMPLFVNAAEAETANEPRVKRTSLSRISPQWPALLINPFDTSCGEDRELAARVKDDLLMELGRYGDVRLTRQSDLARLDLNHLASLRFELRGRLRRQGEDIVVKAHLIDRSTGEQVWADEMHTRSASGPWSSSLDDIPLIIAARIGSENGVIVRQLASERCGDNREPHNSVDTILSCYHFFFSRQLSTFLPTVEALKRTTAREPEISLAWMYLARLYQINHAFELTDLQTPIDTAISHAYQAVLLEPCSARIRCVLAACLLVKGELQAARHELDHALRMNSDSLAYHEIIGWLLALTGDWDRGVPLMRDAVARNPYCLSQVHHGLWADYLRRGELEAAHAAALEYPDRVFFWRDLMITSCLGLLGRLHEARSAAAELLRVKPDFAKRGRLVIGHYIKAPELRDRIHEGLRKAGLALA